MTNCIEKPFEFYRGNDGCEFPKTTVNNWYKARAYILDRLKGIAFKPDEDTHLHVIVNGDSPLMLSVVRQLALSAHYINYDEEKMLNRTVVTIVSSKGEEVIAELKKEEYLNNLLDLCKYTVNNTPEHEDSYIDIEFEVATELPKIDEKNQNEILIQEKEVDSYCNSKSEDEIYSIDTRKAQYADRMYYLGTLIENLPAENIHDASRYSLALDVFQFNKLQDPLGNLINSSEWENNQASVRNGLSNLFCADCFESREASIELCRKDKKQKTAELWTNYNEALSKSEHARWVVEKLIMGFRPLTKEERLEDESIAYDKKRRKEYRDNLKKRAKDPAHIDLCSYRTLRRVNPDDMKYDSFLMLAIPKILEKTKRNK
ncbi:MAG: hypothetical protein J6X58_00580 [Bacteroidales bacterium]|nr:hypothetical protein [Bacteroidales bacterium]